MAAHTPGPWLNEEPYLSEVQTINGKTVASCWYADTEGLKIVINGVMDCSAEESAANARLIAAAPELLDALVAIADDYADRIDLNSGAANPGILHVIAAARAAIAKATQA